MTNVRRLLTAFLSASIAAALVAGCDSKGSSGATKKRDDGKETAAEKQPVTAAFFGKTVAPPGALAKLKWGSSDAEARAAAPELFPKPDKDFQLSDDAKLADVGYGVGLDKETKKLSRMYVQLPSSAAALIAQAWGPGKEAKDSIDRPRTYWFDPATGWRAYAGKGFGDNTNLEFHPYLPAAKLLGDGPDTLGFAPQGILGATIEELRTRFTNQVVETDQAKAAEQQKKVGNFIGKDLAKEVGPASANVRLDLPPTEWGEFWTRIQMHWTDDGKVETVWFLLPYAAHASAKDELRALFDKKWGTPKEEKEFGRTGDPIWIYRAKDPRIVVQDDTISKGWEVRLSTRAK